MPPPHCRTRGDESAATRCQRTRSRLLQPPHRRSLSRRRDVVRSLGGAYQHRLRLCTSASLLVADCSSTLLLHVLFGGVRVPLLPVRLQPESSLGARCVASAPAVALPGGASMRRSIAPSVPGGGAPQCVRPNPAALSAVVFTAETPPCKTHSTSRWMRGVWRTREYRTLVTTNQLQ